MSFRFATTSWTQVLAAREAPSPESRQALEGLCRMYWYPLYAFVRRQGHDPGVEFKYGDAPAMTKSLHVALEDLELDRAWIVYPGRESYRVHEKVAVLPLSAIAPTFSALGQTPRRHSKKPRKQRPIARRRA